MNGSQLYWVNCLWPGKRCCCPLTFECRIPRCNGILLSELHIIFGTQKENSRRHAVAQEVQSHTDEVEDSRIEVNCCLVHGRIERCRSQRGNGLQGSS